MLKKIRTEQHIASLKSNLVILALPCKSINPSRDTRISKRFSSCIFSIPEIKIQKIAKN